MSKLKEIKFSYTASMEKLIIPRLKWLGPALDGWADLPNENHPRELPDEIRNYLMEAATKADERLEEEVPGGTSVLVENEWPDIAPIDTKLKKINPGGEA